MSRIRSVSIEAIQFAPLLVLAAPFVVAGEVDLGAAGASFLWAAGLSVVVVSVLAWRGVLQNPILLGVDVWLCAGAIGFAFVPPLAAALASLQASAMFIGILLVGAWLAFRSETGFIGTRLDDSAAVLHGSQVLLALTLGALVWSFVLPDIRTGGALPFILLNVARRVWIRRASR